MYMGYFKLASLVTVEKCFVLFTARNKRSNHSISNKYYLNGVLLTNNACVLDLSITISFDLSYNAHVNNIVTKALGPTAIKHFIERFCFT